MWQRVAFESLAVGAVLAVALAIAQTLVKIKDIKTAVLVGLVVGAALHLLLELMGANAAYCRLAARS